MGQPPQGLHRVNGARDEVCSLKLTSTRVRLCMHMLCMCMCSRVTWQAFLSPTMLGSLDDGGSVRNGLCTVATTGAFTVARNVFHNFN